jgi:glutamine---fructose-6-phosphate transaminase (isomerizing)
MTSSPEVLPSTVTAAEIASQPQVWRRSLPLSGRMAQLLGRPGERLLVLGCGTSAFVAEALAVRREEAGLGETDAAYASELPARATVPGRYDRVLVLSRSGTTTEVIDALGRIPAGPLRALVTGGAGSPLGALVDDELVLDFADEDSVVQTRFPTTVLLLARAALGEDVTALPAACEAALAAPLPVRPDDVQHVVYLGHGWTVGLAHEAALKVREAAQAWSESYPALDYRHGPVAVAGAGSTVWILGPAPDGLVRDVAATGARVVTGPEDPLVQLVQAQRLAVGMAGVRGLDPDRPRHLTRSVVLRPVDGPNPPDPKGALR